MTDVTFLPDNKRVMVLEGSALLDAARGAGIHTEIPCGGHGLCHRCQVKVVSGEVSLENDGSIPPSLLEKGIVPLCMAHVKSGSLTIEIPSAEKEEGQFTSLAGDLALVDSSLLPRGEHSLLVRIMEIVVPPPVAGDGLSDADRLTSAISRIANQSVELPLDVLRILPDALRRNRGRIAVRYVAGEQALSLLSLDTDLASKQYGLAVDIGTTTISVLLVDLADDRVIASSTRYNSQVACGLDVISRINYARKRERLEELRRRVLSTLNEIIAGLVERQGLDARQIDNISVAGNTTMTHMLLGVVPEYIRLEPYTPAVSSPPVYRADEVGIDIFPGTPVVLAPCVGSYIGGDITSGLLCSTLATDSTTISLFIDIGTNGEIVFGNADFLMGCACSAGPAFEGGGIEKGMRASRGAIERVEVDPETGTAAFFTIGGGAPAGICGSGMISLIAGLLEHGWLDRAGRLIREKPCAAIQSEGRHARYIVDCRTRGGEERIYITEKDIGNVIRAKAAIFSACRVLLRKAGMDVQDISRIFIAGGFGRYLDIENARAIGLIPSLPAERYVFLGNASVSGAYMTLLSASHRSKQRELARKMTYLDLSVEPEYLSEYTAALFLPHTDETLGWPEGVIPNGRTRTWTSS